jgi:putative FmdB family regulatory protein
MPLYRYGCASCGEFDEWRSMAEAGDAVLCPDCGASSPRLVSAPYLGMASERRRAHVINERSAHEPKVVRGRDHADHDHAGGGHKHGGKGWGRSSRPWMVGH